MLFSLDITRDGQDIVYLCALHFHNLIAKVYGGNMGPTWGRQDPGGPHMLAQ